MYAIVKIGGKQFKVKKDQKIFVNRLDEKVDSSVSFDNVMLIDNGGKIAIGNPVLKEARVYAKIEEHLKGEKVSIFKKKRRKNYEKRRNFSPSLTKLVIEKIEEKPSKIQAKTTEKKEPVLQQPEAAEKKPAVKTVKKTTKTPAAKITTKKTTKDKE